MKRKFMNYDLADCLTVQRLYPDLLSSGNIAYAAHAYYPIANLEFTMQEKDFEDFNPIDQTILKAAAYGVMNTESCSAFLGLPERFVRMHMDNLIGRGQLDRNGRLTKDGQLSLQEGKLVRNLHHSRQIFQADALTGTLLTQPFSQGYSQLADSVETDSGYMHIRYKEEIDTDRLIRQLMDTDLIRQYRRRLLNSNVMAVEEIRFHSLYYAPVFMLWLKEDDFPLVFFRRRYDDPEKISGLEPLYCTKKYKSVFPKAQTVRKEMFPDDLRQWRSYVRQAVPSAEELERVFAGGPFRLVSSYTSDAPNGIPYCTAVLEEGEGSLTVSDTAILASASMGIPVSRTDPAKKGRRFTFIPSFSSDGMKHYEEAFFEKWKKDPAGLSRDCGRLPVKGSLYGLMDMLLNMNTEMESGDQDEKNEYTDNA